MSNLRVVMEDPTIESVNSGVIFVVNVVVFDGDKETVHRHISYESTEDVVRDAKKQINTILEGQANLDAWLAAEGRIL